MTSQFAVPNGLSDAAVQRLGQYIQERLSAERRIMAVINSGGDERDYEYVQGRLDALSAVRWVLEMLYTEPVGQLSESEGSDQR